MRYVKSYMALLGLGCFGSPSVQAGLQFASEQEQQEYFQKKEEERIRLQADYDSYKRGLQKRVGAKELTVEDMQDHLRMYAQLLNVVRAPWDQISFEPLPNTFLSDESVE